MEDTKGSAQDPASSAGGKDDKVSYETYRRVLSEAKKYKELTESLTKERETQQEAKLKEQNEYKTLAEQYKKQLDETRNVLTEKERAIQDGLKFSEFQRHLGGKLRHSSYAGHVDFEKILVDPETGRVDEESVKSAVADFVKHHSALVDFGEKGRLPNYAAKGGAPASGQKSPDEMTKEELEKHILEQAKLGKIK